MLLHAGGFPATASLSLDLHLAWFGVIGLPMRIDPDGLTTLYVPPRAVRSVNGPTKPDRLCFARWGSF